ncbi:LysM peptidoglycan-binding domain-containing protein [Pelagicoccus sp. SDUM812002]|uniref:LysM peptidoglycan-binding domain-containing protein n=1 Tax=Pelagicoccus sp. SDUM812002 TaxID=3041266 RepID=UPI00280D818A|nr:LysM peptidoglycan-binding domain-containing protein [Pelagicoccus sp. SDUM812002]MDQ8185454.1 LysM peptidoglycan-binding domain-containing protein [Pelagicoccus sp. SDUM812002]
MKLSAYKTLESSKRAQTLSRIILIAGAHLVIIGGTYLVTNFGDQPSGDSVALAGVGTWSSQSPSAIVPSVDASSSTLFDSRAGNLSGYNAGDGRPVMLANNSASSSGRFAPRRPSSSGTKSSGASQPNPSATTDRDDEFLQPLNQPNDDLYPSYSSVAPTSGLSQTIEYKVQNGDSLWGIGQRFNVDVKDITAVNPGLTVNIRTGQTISIPRTPDSSSTAYQSAATNAPPQPKSVNGSIYTVKSGDVLSRIASRQGLTVAELKAANGLSNDVIRVGQELVIPTRTSSEALVSKQHRGPKVTVEAGDTLDKYAAIYGVSVAELMEINDISNPRLIRIGQTLLIPEKGQSRIRTPEPSVTARPQTTRPSNSTSTRSLPTLEELPRESSEPLPTLDEAFGEEDLDDQPLIQISE